MGNGVKFNDDMKKARASHEQGQNKSLIAQGQMDNRKVRDGFFSSAKEENREEQIKGIREHLKERMRGYNEASDKGTKEVKERTDELSALIDEKAAPLKDLYQKRKEKRADKARLEQELAEKELEITNEKAQLKEKEQAYKTGLDNVNTYRQMKQYDALRREQQSKRNELEKLKQAKSEELKKASIFKRSKRQEELDSLEKEQDTVTKEFRDSNEQYKIRKAQVDEEIEKNGKDYYKNEEESLESKKESYYQSVTQVNRSGAQRDRLKADLYQVEKTIVETSKKASEEERVFFADVIKKQMEVAEIKTAKRRENWTLNRKFDRDAMRYYQITRDKDGNVEELGDAAKCISEYVGSLTMYPMTMITVLKAKYETPAAQATNENPNEIMIREVDKAYVEAENMELDRDAKIAKQKNISVERTEEDGKKTTVTMNSKFEGTGNEQFQGKKASELGLDQDKNFYELINDQDEKERVYENSDKTLHIHHVGLGIGKGRVAGMYIDGEFISADSSKYKSVEDAGVFSRGRVESGERMEKKEEMAQAIHRSPFFQHIYSENISLYSKYTEESVEKVGNVVPGYSAATIDDLKKAGNYDALFQLVIHNIEKTEVQNYLKTAACSEDDEKEMVANAIKTLVASDAHTQIGIDIAKVCKIESVRTAAANASASSPKSCFAIIHACENTDAVAMKKLWRFVEFMAGEGQLQKGSFQEVSTGEGKEVLKGTAVEGMLNLETVNDTYGAIKDLVNLGNGTQKRLKEIDEKLSVKGLDQTTKEALEKQKDALQSSALNQVGDYMGAIQAVFGIIQNVRSFVEVVKNKGLSEEHREEMDEGSRYVCMLDYAIDCVGPIIDAVSNLQDILSLGGNKFEKSGDIISTIKSGWDMIVNIYYGVQNSRKSYNIGKQRDLIKNDASLQQSSKDNSQVLMYLNSAKRVANKKIAENVTNVGTGALDIAGTFTDPVTSAILGLVSTGISTLSNLITNKVFNWREEKSAVKAAFGDDKFYSYPAFDAVLKENTGINSRKDLAAVTRVMSAIDTHVLLRKGTGDDFRLAVTAMRAFYNKPNEEEYRNIGLGSLMKQIDESDWRSTLRSAIS